MERKVLGLWITVCLTTVGLWWAFSASFTDQLATLRRLEDVLIQAQQETSERTSEEMQQFRRISDEIGLLRQVSRELQDQMDRILVHLDMSPSDQGRVRERTSR